MTEAPLTDHQEAVRRMHGCVTTGYIGPVLVHETQDGETVWRGIVHVFKVKHAKAKCAYAWSYIVSDGTMRRRFLAILACPRSIPQPTRFAPRSPAASRRD